MAFYGCYDIIMNESHCILNVSVWGLLLSDERWLNFMNNIFFYICFSTVFCHSSLEQCLPKAIMKIYVKSHFGALFKS